jgi:hypothetical protein
MEDYEEAGQEHPLVIGAESLAVSGNALALAPAEGKTRWVTSELLPHSGGEQEEGLVGVVGYTTEEFYIVNQTSSSIRVFNGSHLDDAIYGQIALPQPIYSYSYEYKGVYAESAMTNFQTISYTTNTGDPYGQAKSCTWTVTKTYNSSCTANVYSTALGLHGAQCTFDGSQSWVDPTTCQLQVVLVML